MVRARLPAGKTLSIAAPASYWYLKGFPIKEIAAVVDYIVYMTYDLHGQWDYANAYANHVNVTETLYALSMITKAGVPANKVYPGYATYGRSFLMNKVGCYGPECTFSAAGAAPGTYTETSGYISYYEIEQIIVSANDETYDGPALIEFEDEGSDILVYDNNQWVSYLKPTRYPTRVFDYVLKGFGGITTWAADLEQSYAADGKGENLDDLDPSDVPVCDFSLEFDTLEDLAASACDYEPECNSLYALHTLMGLFDKAYENYTDINNGYDSKFEAYKRYIKDVAPFAITTFLEDGEASTNGNGYQYFDCVYDNYVDEPIHQRCDMFTYDQTFKGTWKMTMTLIQSKKTEFETQLLKKTGIDPTWITLTGKSSVYVGCGSTGTNPTCPENVGTRTWLNVPELKEDVEIPDPKEVVSEGLGNLIGVQKNMTASWADTLFGQWDGVDDDLVQVFSVPVSMLMQTVESMAQVKDLGEQQEEIEEKERKDLILTIIGALLCIVPFIGEASLLLTGATNLARMAAIAGEVANTAFAVYEMVDDPSSALMGLMGMLVGAGGVAVAFRDSDNFAKMAVLRREVTSGGRAAAFGEIFKKNDDLLQVIARGCR